MSSRRPAKERRPGVGRPSTARSKRLSEPRPVTVPEAVAGTAVEAVREEWVVEDLWWTGRPLRRRYFELVLADGRNTVVFRDLIKGRWYSQRA